VQAGQCGDSFEAGEVVRELFGAQVSKRQAGEQCVEFARVEVASTSLRSAEHPNFFESNSIV
jgi:hypothetical protein